MPVVHHMDALKRAKKRAAEELREAGDALVRAIHPQEVIDAAVLLDEAYQNHANIVKAIERRKGLL